MVDAKPTHRAQLNPEFNALREAWERVFTYLKSKSEAHWYPSILIERRHRREFTVNVKAENVHETLTEGTILRIYDGTTLFEEATCEVGESQLMSLVDRFIHRVKAQGSGLVGRPYSPATWSERLSQKLEEELRSQVPVGVSAQTWVHFGTPQEQLLWSKNEEAMTECKALFHRLRDMEEKLLADHPARQPDYLQSRISLEKCDFVFVDDETRMSQSLLRNMTMAVVMKRGERGFCLNGGLGGRETLELKDQDLFEAYEKLRKSLIAEKITPGRYKVLMHPSITGVFAHEAFGHSQEGDTWARGRSKARELYETKEKVGNEHATILNNPAIYQNGMDGFAAWGSYYFDEEGWLAQEHYLVKEGVLQRPMTHLTSAVRLGVPRTANGKRENWTHGVYTRQTNTYFSAGDKTLGEMMAMVDYGFLAVACFGGMEDPKGMGIQVGMAYVEEIRNGELTGRTFKAPNGGAIQMTGYVPDYLKSILAKSKIEAHHDEMDESGHPWNEVGGCGKYHKEFVVAGCGGPYMLVDDVLLS
ncbi:MAG: TldD/PmbA family protein [Bdellovibrionales bacterium]|nr:TldD/PmbA family protein [Bdellovibrionales bacterium]